VSHPELINKTPFVLDTLFLADESGVPLCVPVMKATLAITPDGVLGIAPAQLPLLPAGEPRGDPAVASYVYEPEIAFHKVATDVVLIGHAHANPAGVSEVTTGIRVGPVQKLVRVVGDRAFAVRGGTTYISAPRPFERIPLIYERAFGGWDRRNPNAEFHAFEPRNPVGCGFRESDASDDDEMRLPNLEDPEQPWRSAGDRPPPAGFGFLSPNWAPRSHFVGTYDAQWEATRSPLLPVDFDRRFFSAATPGLIAPGYLRGNESVTTLNVSPEGRLAFALPGFAPLAFDYQLRNGRTASLPANLDTLIVNMDARIVVLLWRASFALPRGPLDVATLRVTLDTAHIPAAA
jgi:hypothetical protein